MKKVNISICSSPTCYVEGAKLFKQLDGMMSARMKASSTITGTPCQGHCSSCGSNAPCALIDNQPLCNATPARIMQAVTRSY